MAAENKRLSTRMASELRSLATAPPPGVLCYARGDSLTQLEAVLAGPAGTVYEGGVFRLDVVVPTNYPFAPCVCTTLAAASDGLARRPLVTFRTPVYHPNIDAGGRICLDILNSKPKVWRPLRARPALLCIRDGSRLSTQGAWTPSLSVALGALPRHSRPLSSAPAHA